MGNRFDLLGRAVYGMGQVDRILGRTPGTARRWIDGYERGGRSYKPVIRETSTGAELVTWGEFVETRLLSEYRDSGVSILRMRPAIEVLRDELNTRYPLASAAIWLAPTGREFARRVQVDADLPSQLFLVTSGLGVLPEWTPEAQDFRRSSAWKGERGRQQIVHLQPRADISEVVLDPLVSFGEPTIASRGVRTDIIGELIRAGETPEGIAAMYDLDRRQVDAAIRYELLHVPA